MKQITVILPVHEVNDSNKSLIERAIKSAKHDDVELLIVHPPSVARSSFAVEGDVKMLINAGETDFCSQVNLGIDSVETEWFSILELDDQYSPSWFNNVAKYRKAFPDVDAFLPIVADVDHQDKFLSFTNESLWAVGFSNLQGYLDNEVLLEYENYQINGAVYRTDKVKKYGKFKTNITLSFGYEYLLRLTHNNAKIYAIPKIGYKHTNLRENSLFWKYKNEVKLTQETTKFWMDAAKKEYYFTEQREINVP